mmetsp:Transcript_13338/g.42153  ORF Transcript_13338/g.42153 Transcript_13338/m.42153 type:complete len:358 (-) Transcript_13338:132-1205(-)
MRWTLSVVAAQKAERCSRLSVSKEVGCFARRREASGEVAVLWDDEARARLRRCQLPATPLDLNAGYESFVAKDLSETSLESAEAVLVSAAARYGAECEVITFRNNLNKICKTPYAPNDAWSMGVHRRGASVVLSIRNVQSGTDRQSYYGYAFEAAATGRPAVDVDEEYATCVRLDVAGHSLFVAAEIDCVDDNGSFVELKTTALLETQRLVRNFERFKLLKFWIQSALVAVPTIVCGFRDDAGTLRKIQRFRTADLPGFARRDWSPDVVTAFLAAVLDFLADALKADDSQSFAHFELAYDPARRLIELRTAPPPSEPPGVPLSKKRKAADRPESEPRQDDRDQATGSGGGGSSRGPG